VRAACGSSAAPRAARARSFGHHLRTLREAAGLSRAALARRAVVPTSTLRNWQADRGFPGPAAGLRLAEALGVTPERSAGGVDDPAEDEALAAEAEARRRRNWKGP
jgi:transcriptional regulator with XRE-family HTH domain